MRWRAKSHRPIRARIVAPPPRLEELQDLAARYPGGAFFRAADCDRPMLLSYTAP